MTTAQTLFSQTSLAKFPPTCMEQAEAESCLKCPFNTHQFIFVKHGQQYASDSYLMLPKTY